MKKWRISTLINRTKDEYIIWLNSILNGDTDFTEIIIGSVVPDITEELKIAISDYLKKKPLVIAEDIKVRMIFAEF